MQTMTREPARREWSDDRLDGLNEKVDRGFEHVDQRFEQVDQRFEQVDQRFERVEGELRANRVEISEFRKEMNSRFDGLNQTLIVSAFGLAAALIASRAIPF